MLRTRKTFPGVFVRRASSTAASSKSKLLKAKEDLSIEKNPLIDTFGRHHTYLRISLTERCNLRCNYCMPEEGVLLSQQSKLLTTDEILYLAHLFVQQGITKIRLTGGEPTIRKDLPQLIDGLKKLKGLTDGVSITTNGLMLTKQLVGLQRAGLDGLNISLDTLKAKKFEAITRRKGWERVMAGIDLALQLGYDPVKINCVLMKDVNDDEITDFVQFTKDRKLDVRFIEYMPFDGNKWTSDKIFPYKRAIKLIADKYPNLVKLKDGPNDTSKAYKVIGHKGQIGFITSMSDHFCNTCNRLRLTADGNLKVCLFENREISLRDAIRSKCSEDDLVSLISAAVKKKKKQHAGRTREVNYPGGNQNKNWYLLPDFSKCKLMFIGKSQEDFITEQFIIELLDGKPKDGRKFRVANINYSSFHVPSINNKKVGHTQSIRMLTSRPNLTHTDDKGQARMVNIGSKSVSRRTATAEGTVYLGPIVATLIRENNLKKGDAISVAKLAGVMAAKKTSELIPLCHNITLNNIQVSATLKDEFITIKATVTCDGKTGVEMEALTAVSIAALTIYDMCKAVSHDIIIKNIRLLEKTGGERGDYHMC